MEVEAHQFDRPITAILRQIIVNPMYGIAPDEKAIETEMEKLGKVLDVYEERLSKCKYQGQCHNFSSPCECLVE
jgi:glutathione S-transferase